MSGTGCERGEVVVRLLGDLMVGGSSPPHRLNCSFHEVFDNMAFFHVNMTLFDHITYFRAPSVKLASIPTLVEPPGSLSVCGAPGVFKSNSFDHSPASCDSSRTSSRQSAISPPIGTAPGSASKDRPVLKRRSTEEHSNSSTNSTGSQPKHSNTSNTNTGE